MMFDFFKKVREDNFADELNNIYSILSDSYGVKNISDERKSFLKEIIVKNGYLPYPYEKALKEITPAETLFGLTIKWKLNDVFNDESGFVFKNEKLSVLARSGVQNSDWIKREGHDIKLINLSGLGNKTDDCGKFFDWLLQLLILPNGNLTNKIFSTTIYLTPFHPREFGCAYLPKSFDVSENLFDKNVFDLTGLDAKGQVKTFIKLSQLAGHPVIYDILPQTGRFSKIVLANPYIARWFDIKQLQGMISAKFDDVSRELAKEFDDEDLLVVKKIYFSDDNCGEVSPYYQDILNKIEDKMNAYKKEFSAEMMKKSSQEKIRVKVKSVISQVEDIKFDKNSDGNQITKQYEIVKALIGEGLWPACGGAWCSSGVPVYDKMSICGGYPLFKHYDYKGEDVTSLANLDCQTPYYFAYLEDGAYNEPVINFFVKFFSDLQDEYNFDGYRIDHVDHVVDVLSENGGKPISYRIPKLVLNRLNAYIKSKKPYFATLAEYMLSDNYYKEYHQDMKFDLFWGDDIICQDKKNPQEISDNNVSLANYNVQIKDKNYLSILKTYNNQDGEFDCINKYPAQLGEDGALFKWFMYKFLPGGKFANRPMLYVDGDESFTVGGIENAIGEEISMQRGKNYDFYLKFNAIDNFVKNNHIIVDGEAHIMRADDDGFFAWIITKEPYKNGFLIIANYCDLQSIEGNILEEKQLILPVDFCITACYELSNGDFIKTAFENNLQELNIEKLNPFQFRLFEITKK